MKKIKFLKLLNQNNIKYLLLSDNSLLKLKNEKKDLDIFIPLYYKAKFETLIKNLGFLKRIETVSDYPLRYFFYNINNIENYNLDVMYELSLKKNFIFKKKFNHTKQILSSRIKKKNIFFTRSKHLKLLKLITKKKTISQKYKQNFSLEINFNFNFKIIPKSNYLLFIGSDGTGKSTIIEHLKKRLKIKSITYNFGQSEIGWALKLNKILFNSYFFKKVKIANYFLFFDILLRRIKMLRYSNNKLILIDRFPGFIFSNKSIINYIIKFLLPKPDLVILLLAKEKTRKKRKPKEIKDDQKKWHVVAKSLNCETLKLWTDISKPFMTENKIIKKVFSNKIYINNILH